MAYLRSYGYLHTMVEFLFGISMMLNILFVVIWVIGSRMNKRRHEEFQKMLEDGIGQQLTEYYKNWGYKA